MPIVVYGCGDKKEKAIDAFQSALSDAPMLKS